MEGTSILNGIAIGTLRVVKRFQPAISNTPATDPEAELLRFEQARCRAIDQQNALYEEAMEKAGDRQKAMHCYRLSTRTSFSAEAFHAMGRIEKREGHVENAVRLYQTMLAQRRDPVGACEALAKLYEHQLHDLPAAVSYTRQALLILSEPTLFQNQSLQERQSALQYRYARLRRKLSAQTR